MKPLLALLAAVGVAAASPATMTTITIPKPYVSAIPASESAQTGSIKQQGKVNPSWFPTTHDWTNLVVVPTKTAALPVTASKESSLSKRKYNPWPVIVPSKWAPTQAATTNSEGDALNLRPLPNQMGWM